jgi:hypothetical protein
MTDEDDNDKVCKACGTNFDDDEELEEHAEEEHE